MKITCENCVENEISMQVLLLAFSAAAAGAAAFKRRVRSYTHTHWELWEHHYTTLTHTQTLHRYIF